MIDHLRAIRDLLRANGFSAHVGHVPADSPYPTASIQAPGWGAPDEPPLCGPAGIIESDFRVVVGDTTDSNAHVRLQQVRDILSPGGLDARLSVPGRYATTTWVRSEFVGSDPSLTLDATNRHPGIGVDTYRLDSQPL